MGTTLRELIYDIGGGIPDGKKFKAIQTGGPSGGCLTEEDLDTPIDFDTLVARGSMMGSGGAIVMDEDNCMVDVAKFHMEFICDESCGKCSPCRIGTKRMLEILTKITNGKAETAYADGYTAAGMWYANGTGGDNRRYAQIDTISAGDEVVVYTGASNSADLSVHFTYLGEGGTQDDVTTVPSGEMAKLSFVAEYSGSYKIWYDTSVSGKPVINRIVRYPATAVTGTITNLADATTSGCIVSLKNDTTGDTFETAVQAGDNTFTVNVTPGYTYSATLKGVTGWGFTFATKSVEVPYSAITAGGTSASFAVEPKETYDVTGNLVGFASSYDTAEKSLLSRGFLRW